MTDIRASSRLMMIGAIVAYFLLWLGPRVAPIKANVLMAEDFGCSPEVHLKSYRPLLAADLALWNFVLGPEYLRSRLPKIFAGIYLALSAGITLSLLRRWGAPLSVAFIMPVFFLAHPIVNQLSLWNLITGLNLAMLLILAGYWIMKDASSAPMNIAAFSVLLWGLCGYQLYAAMFPVLLVGEFMIRRLHGTPMPRREIARKVAVMVLVTVFYAAYVVVSQRFFRLHDYGDRGFISPATMTVSSYLHDKWHGMTNMFANVFQPLISYYFGINAAWFAWKWVPVVIGGATFVCAALRKRRIGDVLIFSLSPLVLPGLTTLVLLPMSVTPSGWRVCGPVLFAFCLSLVPALSLVFGVDASPEGNNPGSGLSLVKGAELVAVVLLAILLSYPVTAYDGRLRVSGKEKQLAVLKGIEQFWAEQGVVKERFAVTAWPEVKWGPSRYVVPGENKDIVVNFRKVSAVDYSSLLAQFWAPFAAYYGFNTIDGSRISPGLTRRLESLCASADKGQYGLPLAVTHLEAEKISVICR